jgi:hypothetical protein
MRKDPRFKEKFPEIEEDEDEPEITIRLKTGKE